MVNLLEYDLAQALLNLVKQYTAPAPGLTSSTLKT